MSELVIKNGHVLTPDMQLKQVDVLIEEGIITQVGDCQCAGKIIDARGCVVMPGLINTHTHSPMTLLRGCCENRGFEEWQQCIWDCEKKLTPPDIRLGSRLACMEMIKSGTTTFADTYIHMGEVAKAVTESGLRSVLGWGIIEGFGEPVGEKLIHRQRFVKQYGNSAGGRITTMYAPHSPLTCSKEVLSSVKRLAEQDGSLVTLHLLETEKEEKILNSDNYHLGILEDAGLLSKRLLVSHCVWASEGDLDVLSRKGVSVSHNPLSNLKLNVGIAPVAEMLSRGVNVCLGTDGAAPSGSLDMFDVMRTAALLANSAKQQIVSEEFLKMATLKGAKALGLNTGVIREGGAGDIILVDMKKSYLSGCDPFDALVYSASGRDVKATVVGGEVLMEDYGLLTLDEVDIISCFQEFVTGF